jgi:hypothetical protein
VGVQEGRQPALGVRSGPATRRRLVGDGVGGKNGARRGRPIGCRSGWVISQASCTKFWPPFAPWVQGGAGMGWVCSGGPNLAPGPLGLVAGDPDRHRGWLLCPSSVPRVFSAHRPLPQLQVHAPACAVTAHPLARRLQTGRGFLYIPISTVWPGLCLCANSDGRSGVNPKSGPRVALPAHRLHLQCTTR